MQKFRVVFADPEQNYTFIKQMQLLEQFEDEISLEVITSETYFRELFSSTQEIDVLLVSVAWYTEELKNNKCRQILLLQTDERVSKDLDEKTRSVYKYCQLGQEIIPFLVPEPEVPEPEVPELFDTKILVVTSAAGGVGKTTIAMALAERLTKESRKVLYVNAEQMNTFQCRLQNQKGLSSDICDVLRRNGDLQMLLSGEIRTEGFSYVPPFSAPLDMFGLDDSTYEKMIQAITETKEYELIIVDLGNLAGSVRTGILDRADQIFLITDQRKAAAFATSLLALKLESANDDRFAYICNDYRPYMPNSFRNGDVRASFVLEHYVHHVEGNEELEPAVLAENPDIAEIAELI